MGGRQKCEEKKLMEIKKSQMKGLRKGREDVISQRGGRSRMDAWTV